MRRFLFIAGIVFVITLAVVMGTRMSPDALAVVIGIICGVLASIPTSAMLVWVMRQRDKQVEMQLGQRPFGGQYPPVVVVNGQGTNGYGTSYPTALPVGSPPLGPRNFKVIGQENTEAVGDVLPTFWDEIN
ncbi:MAG TPA: hypothetical protein VEC96_09530 [Anaerolineae bacterium]|nr:hypothetical protein [Anaerolineae bacterium]HXV99433.1 hypothetical protein [Anaerolineae bacterium]